MTAPPSLIADRYQCLQPIGEGGMGRVWLGLDTKLKRTVALKEIGLTEGQTAADMREAASRALREARAAARLSHPNAVRVFDIVATEPAPWIVMEYVPSRSLFQVVAESGPLAPAAAARYGLDVLAALTAAHRVGVMHRDVKPSNVLITEADRAVLTDFGMATIVGDPAVTRSGVVIGSPAFMAPERAADQAVGPEADLWSLGATLYFAVVGHSPYQRGSVLATLSALATEDPPYPPAAGPLWPVLSGLLRRDPRERLSATAARSMLLRVLIGTPASSRRQPVPISAQRTAVLTPPARSPVAIPAPSSRRPWRWWATLAAVFVLTVLVWFGLRDSAGPVTANRGTGSPRTPTATPSATSASASPSATPSPSAAGAPSALVLPAGWHRYTDRTGFSVAVPDGWVISRQGSIVYFNEPGGSRLLGIDQTDHPQPDPVADWQGKEQYRVARGDFPAYQRVRLEAVDYFIKAADWEFTYNDSDGDRRHVNNRGFITSPHQAYGMWWSTLDKDWAANRPNLELIERSFIPAG
jgi:eukaryotic-like serine/threonine-protein kinase